MKTCRDCGATLPLDAFYYVDRRRSERRRPECKGCHAERMRAYSQTPAGRRRVWRANQRAAESGIRRAHWAVKNAIRRGILQRQPCEVCGREDVHAHHEDYSQPLSVRWLCPEHHGIEHRQYI